MAVNADTNSTSTEPTSEFTTSSSQNTVPGCSSLVCLHEEDVPGASLNGREPSQLHVMELKYWFKCRLLQQSGREEAGPCEAVSRRYNSV